MAYWMKKPNTGKHTRFVKGKKEEVMDGQVIECTEADLGGARNKFVEVPNPRGSVAKFSLDVVETEEGSGLFDVVRGDTGRKINDRPLIETEAHDLVRTVYDTVIAGVATAASASAGKRGGSVRNTNDGKSGAQDGDEGGTKSSGKASA